MHRESIQKRARLEKIAVTQHFIEEIGFALYYIKDSIHIPNKAPLIQAFKDIGSTIDNMHTYTNGVITIIKDMKEGQQPKTDTFQQCRFCWKPNEVLQFSFCLNKCQICMQCRVNDYQRTKRAGCPGQNCQIAYSQHQIKAIQEFQGIEEEEQLKCQNCKTSVNSSEYKCENNCPYCATCIRVKNFSLCTCGGRIAMKTQEAQTSVKKCVKPNCAKSDKNRGTVLKCGHFAHFTCLVNAACPGCVE